MQKAHLQVRTFERLEGRVQGIGMRGGNAENLGKIRKIYEKGL